jgi:hypothetical protein
MTKLKEKEKEINISLKNDVLNTIGNIYKINAPYAIGYLFYPDDTGKKVYRGMYCNFESEIDHNKWDYYYDFKSQKIYKLIEA